MHSYSALAADWHLLHPLHLATVDFLTGQAGPLPARCIDAGCATGEYAGALAARGYEAHGIELDRALYDAAVQRHGAAVRLVHGDLLEAFDLVRGPLALAYAIGGTLCELGSTTAVADVVAQLLDLTRPAGRVVLEVPNFDHLRHEAQRLHATALRPDDADDVRYGGLEDASHPHGSPQLGSVSAGELRLYLPAVSAFRDDGAELRYERHYSILPGDSDRGVFTLVWQLTTPEGDFTGERELLTLTHARLAAELPADCAVAWFGDYDGADWTPASPYTIAVLG